MKSLVWTLVVPLSFKPELVFCPRHQDRGRGRPEVGAAEVDPLL